MGIVTIYLYIIIKYNIMPQPATSIAAHNHIKSIGLKQNHHKLILDALQKGDFNYEEIAAQTRLDKTQVNRRLSELRGQTNENGQPLIYRLPLTKKTSSGCNAAVYSLHPTGRSFKPFVQNIATNQQLLFNQ